MLQDLIVGAVLLLLLGLLLDGWFSGSVWVKGSRDHPFSLRHLAHKRYRDEDPWPYWFAMGFYTVAAVCLAALIALR